MVPDPVPERDAFVSGVRALFSGGPEAELVEAAIAFLNRRTYPKAPTRAELKRDFDEDFAFAKDLRKGVRKLSENDDEE